MPKKAARKEPKKKQTSKKSKSVKKKSKKIITVQNPVNPDVAWEVELLDIGEKEFLTLWNSGSDRIGFNPSGRAIYDRTKVIATITKEIRLSKSEILNME